MDVVVSALSVYPVKSCRGVAVARSAVEARGLRHDRRWMLVDEQGAFVTQRTFPTLAQVEVALVAGGAAPVDAARAFRMSDELPRDPDELVLQAPGTGELRLPAVPPGGAARRRVTVWRDQVEAIDCGVEASRWFSAWLGTPVALVFMPDEVLRPVNPKYARADDVVGFADGFPLLLASASSLDDLNARMAAPLPMDRFRPNIVVQGAAPWAEDTWRRVRVGDLTIRVAKPCSRCVVTTTDQGTAVRGAEPMRALARFRRMGNEVMFAQNAVPDAPGTIAVGDAITLLDGLPRSPHATDGAQLVPVRPRRPQRTGPPRPPKNAQARPARLSASSTSARRR